jgi:hypothetical protein
MQKRRRERPFLRFCIEKLTQFNLQKMTSSTASSAVPAPTAEEQMIEHLSGIRARASKIGLFVILLFLLMIALIAIVWIKQDRLTTEVSEKINTGTQAIAMTAVASVDTLNKSINGTIGDTAKVLIDKMEAEGKLTRITIGTVGNSVGEKIDAVSKKAGATNASLDEMKGIVAEQLAAAKRMEEAQAKAIEEARQRAEADAKAVADALKTVSQPPSPPPAPTPLPQMPSLQQRTTPAGPGLQSATTAVSVPKLPAPYHVEANTFSHRTYSKEEVEAGRVRFTNGVKVKALVYFKPGTFFHKDTMIVDVPLPTALGKDVVYVRFGGSDVDFDIYLYDK